MVSCHNSFGFIWFGFEQKVEMQVDINCGKCKNQIMQAVTELEGVNQVVLDEEKSLLTVVGTMDPICIAEQLRKIKQNPVVVNIGPPKPPEAKPEKKPECCKPCLPYYHNTCDLPYYNYNTRDMVSVSSYESGSGCTIV
ncbi:heavy metal-associated isoprenylated plant protein 2-like isoform X1 [Brassica napus]|uniref:heavy metal-associated isoprenylated plant protein 2-like isoform X1 n=1 Tax=Brassica napus TaxID=3708 RepID=UPI002078C38A|nr:heavy metal-associated isoprenylated plant protein 2-like isoform X1 [Brassica napus]XP_048629447.1 heavy metal-associated isoprenylated plant protein 2-like isoform X1 [Brassica napus]